MLNALSFAYVNVPGQGENAVDLARKMLALSQELVAAAPGNDDFLELLINSEIRLGDTLETRGVLDEGLQHLLQAREALVKFVDKDPSNSDRLRMLVYLQQRIGELATQEGRPSEGAARV